MKKLVLILALTTITGTVFAAQGIKKYGKCWIKNERGQVVGGFDCNLANVTCPNPGYGTKCTVDGVAGIHKPDIARRELKVSH